MNVDLTPLELGSDRWFEHALELCTELPTREGLSWRLQLGAGEGEGEGEDEGQGEGEGEGAKRWHQVVEDGRVVTWAPGELDRRDLELRWPFQVARGVHRSEVSGTGAMAALRVVDPSGVEGPAPPLDILLRPELGALPSLAGATFTVQYEFRAGPFGTVWSWMSFVDGRVAGMAFERIDEPDVEVGITYRSMVRVRTGAITILEALEDGGRVTGDLGPLMLLAGMEESPELHAAEVACGPAGGVLADIGELSATPEYQTVLRRLAEVTA